MGKSKGGEEDGLSRQSNPYRRKTRGQDGSLLLSSRTLSFPTTCRFDPGARTRPAHDSFDCHLPLSFQELESCPDPEWGISLKLHRNATACRWRTGRDLLFRLSPRTVDMMATD
jgi:hypothetical protein